MGPESPRQRWRRLKTALGKEPLPAALVDLDAFEANAADLYGKARATRKTLRIASKSLRCPDLLQRLAALGGSAAGGWMTYHARETAFLGENGFDDLLLAYPTVQESDLEAVVSLAKGGKTVSVVVDENDHLNALEAVASRAGIRAKVVLEVDVSYRPFGTGLVHLGVRRSPLRGAQETIAMAKAVGARPHLELHGVMTYEAQIAGSTDRSPFTRLLNAPKRAVKLLSRGPVESTRGEVARALREAGFKPVVFNGGGTGSLGWAASDSTLTEVTAGSGFLDSHLFDYYRDFTLQPASYFALQVVRRPARGMVTCHGGGLVASGESGRDRLPIPALPAGLKLIGFEGAGEVQTPLVLPSGVELALGDPVFFRHAKAGELAEHFNEYLLVRGERIEARAPTYRGLGKVFLG